MSRGEMSTGSFTGCDVNLPDYPGGELKLSAAALRRFKTVLSTTIFPFVRGR